MNKALILIILVLQSFNSFSQTYWRVENEYGDEILLTIDLNKEKKTFEAYSRKDALKDLAGVFTYALAKAAGKLKYPEIVFIEGKTREKNDSLLLNGNFNYFDKQFLFTGSISGSHFDGLYKDNRFRQHQLTGEKVFDNKSVRDYTSIINTAFSLTEKHIVNPAWLKSDEWLDFKKKVNELKVKTADDYELAAIFFWLGKKLPFTSYEINRIRPENKPNGRKNSAAVREIKSNIAIFDGNNFPANQKEMDSIALIISKKDYSKLVIDLRGNSRLSPLSVNILTNYLSEKAFNGGVYLTRKWFDSNNTIPKAQDYQKLFKGFSEASYQPGVLFKEQGRSLYIAPTGKTFKGKVYVLADSKTSKAAEAMTYALKQEKIAIIVGQKTAGMTVLTESLRINNEFDLLLPNSDFYTIEGKNLNKVGVEPDISLPADEVMTYIMKL
ncbi:MAG: S41 family peptidase [Mariniphaga sp.]